MVPLVGILLVLGGAYAWSVARSVQQEFFNQQLGDLSYFVTSARQALRADNPSMFESEAERYGELFGTQVAVVDRTGSLWASGGEELELSGEDASAQIGLALSGRRSELAPTALPWSLGESVVVEPVFDDGNAIGAVVISASVEVPRGEILRHWVVLVTVSALVTALLFFAVLRLATWVLKPMRRVDSAMVAIEQGDMEARIDDDTGPPEMRRMIRVFNRMAGQIERVVARQQEFAMNASHELRNPLGALLLRVEYLATGLDEGWSDDVEKTREEGRRMARILDTLLSMARGGRGDSPFAVVDLTELAAGRARAWEDAALQREVRLDFMGEQGGGAVLSLTDRTAVESALDAVIDNAVKFSPRGAAIELATARDGDGCLISVRDHGPGLAPDELDRVTSRFWRSPRDQNVPGSGLGLAIATDLLEAMNGEVRVTTPSDGGLMVALKLPAGDAG